MERGRIPRIGLAVALAAIAATPAAGFDIDRDVVTVRSVDLPTVAVDGLDFDALRAEVSMGAVVVGEPTARTTRSVCVPKGSKNVLKDAIEIDTYYYDVPYRAAPGVVVVRDGDGAVVHAATIGRLVSSERFGHDDCRYWLPGRLESDFGTRRGAFRERIRAGAGRYAVERATAAIDDALFAVALERKVPLYTFKDRKRDYTDLNEAARLARAAYGATLGDGAPADRDPGMDRAIAIWETALAESDPSDKRARINRKVTSKIHESLGVAHLVRGDAASAVAHLEKALHFARMTTSRSNGTGTEDLLARAREAADRGRTNPSTAGAEIDLDELMRAAAAHRGRIPVQWSPSSVLPELRAERDAFASATIVERTAAERDRRDVVIASGPRDGLESGGQCTSMQGTLPFPMPIPENLGGATQALETAPDEIGRLSELEDAQSDCRAPSRAGRTGSGDPG
jgi:hypothetical protein